MIFLLRLNPELQKGLWLDLSETRLIGTPAMGFLILILLYVIDPVDAAGAVRVVMYSAAIGFGVFVGVMELNAGFRAEFSESTWDLVRLNPTTPWQLTWGILFGRSSYAWYGMLISLILGCGVLLALSALSMADLLVNIPLVIGLSLIAQSVVLIALLGSPPQRGSVRTSASIGIFMLLLFMSSLLYPILVLRAEPVAWWVSEIDPDHFWPASLYAWLFWFMVCAHRLMRTQLQFDNSPLPWIAFNLFVAAYVAGFVSDNNAMRLISAVVSLAVLTYTVMLLQPLSAATLRRYYLLFRRMGYPSLIPQLPIWTFSWLLAVGLLLVSVGFMEAPSTLVGWLILLFILRDALLFSALQISRRKPLSVGLVLVVLATLYGLLPAIFRGLDFDQILPVFWPSRIDPMGIMVVGVEVLVVAAFVIQRTHRILADLRQPT
jgi:hypothetical protein